MNVKSQKGAAVVEFAVVLPLLLLILFGIIEFGFLLYNQAMLTNASREGARYGIVAISPRHSSVEISNVVRSYSSDYLVTFQSPDPGPETQVCITPKDEDMDCTANPSVDGLQSAEDYLTVKVTYKYKFLFLSRFGDNLGIKTLSASTTMLAE